MARTSALKASTIMTTTKEVSDDSKVNNKSAAMKAVTLVLAAGKTMIQSINIFEAEVENARLKCLEHAEKHGDTMPMDRLVKGLMELNHPSTTRLAQEVVASLRSVSPIRWDSKGNVKQLKEGQEGYEAYDVVSAGETAFYQTPMAVRARKAADDAHKKGLKPMTYKDLVSRTKGIIATVSRAQEPDKNGEVRGIAKGDGQKIKRFLSDLQSFLVDHGGEAVEETVEQATKKAA